MNYWSAGKALYDPARLPCQPCCFTPNGTRTSELPRARLFRAVEDTPYKRLIELSEERTR